MEHSSEVEVVGNQLVLGPATLTFQRTLRIPEIGLHPLPPVEGQITGQEVHGGVQLRAVGLTAQALRSWQASDYDEDRSSRVFVHLCSAAEWTAITGEVPPPSPVDRDAYVEAGLPWFDYYDADAADLAASDALKNVKGVSEWFEESEKPFVPVDPAKVVTLKGAPGHVVTDGDW